MTQESVHSHRLYFDESKTRKLIQQHSLLQSMFERLVKKQKSERSALEQIFKTYVIPGYLGLIETYRSL